MKRLIWVVAAVVVAAVAALVGLGQLAGPPVALSIVAGSENKTLEPLMMDWAKKNNVTLTLTYLGSVDISRELEKGTAGAYDAVWPANSLWIALGDSQKVVKHSESILRSPGRSVRCRLEWSTCQNRCRISRGLPVEHRRSGCSPT